MASEDVLRYVQWSTLSIYYKLDVLGLFYGAKNIGQNRVSTYFIWDQNSLLVRYESRYMNDSLSYGGASL